jgi:hypothetical protein
LASFRSQRTFEARAARPGIEGNFYQGWKCGLETDFAESTVDLEDAYIDYSGKLVEPARVIARSTRPRTRSRS